MEVSDAFELSMWAHYTQTDKSGHPYFTTHICGVVAELVERDDFLQLERGQKAVALSVAFLHDVLEDTDVTFEELLAIGFSGSVALRVSALTRGKCSTAKYYELIRKDPITRMVKLADIANNTDPTRTALLDDETRARLDRKYQRAREALDLRSAVVS